MGVIAPDAVIHMCHPFGDIAGADVFAKMYVPLLDAMRADAAELASFAESAGGVDGLIANPVFASTKALADDGKFAYSRFDAIGLFRMLELTAATDPAALEKLAEASGLQLKKVNGDLGMYKNLLSRLAAAKELQAEIMEREKRKTAERLAKKEEAAASKATEEASA